MRDVAREPYGHPFSSVSCHGQLDPGGRRHFELSGSAPLRVKGIITIAECRGPVAHTAVEPENWQTKTGDCSGSLSLRPRAIR